MDALPVTEETDLPFKSVATSEFRGEKVGVMHACGHDGHTAILMGAASVLAAMREELPGTVMFVFQPAEEGAPQRERGGAALMLEEGLFSEVKPEAMFALHLRAELNVGQVGYRSGPIMAGSDRFRIVVTGRSTHGGRPWQGVDPIVTASQIVLGLQTIVSRQTDITRAPVVVSVGSIKGGVRNNIIPDTVELIGTVRTFDPEMRRETLERIERIATQIAAARGCGRDGRARQRTEQGGGERPGAYRADAPDAETHRAARRVWLCRRCRRWRRTSRSTPTRSRRCTFS
jgi:amidohydrolase